MSQTLNGQIIGQAERATRSLLDALLERGRTSFETWVALRLVATGQVASAGELHARLASGLGLAPDVAASVIEAARREDLIVGEEAPALGAAGHARYEAIRAPLEAVTARLYGDLPREDLVVAARVLEEITARARALHRQGAFE